MTANQLLHAVRCISLPLSQRILRRDFIATAIAAALGVRCGSRAVFAADRRAVQAALERATKSADIAGYAISKVQRWLHEKALPMIDPDTGLYRADGRWNYHDTAADCYPFLCWAAWLVDPEALYGPVLNVLRSEQRLCNHVGALPVPFDWSRREKDTTVSWEQIVFGASEYAKDGLVAVVELLGRGPWFTRMQQIEEDLWQRAREATPFGRIVSTNVEVNGEQLQVLARLFARTGDTRYLEWAERTADYYLSDPDYVPAKLRDHGCEIIGGLGLLLAVEYESGSKRVGERTERLKHMFDTVAARGVNPDGLMFNWLGKPDSGLSDGWGYNYVAFLCWDRVAGEKRYEPLVRQALASLAKAEYRDYPWEGRHNIDGYADSIEGAIYLLNRIPVPEGFAWVDREMARHVLRSNEPLDRAQLWGTMKLESNGVRTVIMHALMHTCGIVARPWRQDLKLGAARLGEGVLAYVRADRPWSGRLCFDGPRHRECIGFRFDWPRMNTLPEWFVVWPDKEYRWAAVGPDGTIAPGRAVSGGELREGLAVDLKGGEGKYLAITPA